MKRHPPGSSDDGGSGAQSELMERMEERLLDRLVARLADPERVKRRRMLEPVSSAGQAEAPMKSEAGPTITTQGTGKTQGLRLQSLIVVD